jgi:hypothetical protein
MEERDPVVVASPTVSSEPASMRRRLLLLSTVFVAAIAACVSDSPVAPPSAPAAPASANASLLGLGGTTVVTPLHRTVSLSQSLSTSATLGPLGGTLSIPGAGVLVVVPPLALSSTQTITVTAVAGSNVAYEFAPHGLKFNVPLVVTQSLAGTEAGSKNPLVNPLSLFAGYFPDSTKPTSISERLNVNLNLLNQVATFTVWHFSGYILASGDE